MKWKKYNTNPQGRQVGDCAVRAVSKALGIPWDDAYLGLVIQGYMMKDLPNANAVWGEYLKGHGFRRRMVPDTCPECYTLEAFCEDHPKGTYVVAFGTHVVAVCDGWYYDTWESGNEIPIYYFERQE